MSIEVVRDLLAWCTVINYVILLIWFFFMALANDWMFRIHTKWFKIKKEKFDEIHYLGMAIYKILILLFNLVPYLTLRIFL